MIQFANVSKQFGNKILYKNANFQLNPGDKVGLVGPNGAGKSTLFRMIIGEENPDQGAVSKPDKISVGYFSQDAHEMSGRTVMEEMGTTHKELPVIKERLLSIETLLASPSLKDNEMESLLAEYGELQGKFEQYGGYDLEARASEILTGLGILPEDHNSAVESFSGGWKMRIQLAKILLLNPDVLVMDEPTNHLDMESIIWLESWLSTFPGTLFMTSHDRDFMNRLVNKIVEVANQKVTVFSGNYDFFEREKKIRAEQLLASAKRQEDMLQKEKEFISRFAARASHAAQVQSRVKKLEKMDIIEIPPEEQSIRFVWPEPPRSGDEVVRFENLGKTWPHPKGYDKLIFRGASGLIKRLDRVAVVGINGAGKSTFLKIIAGHTQATEGKMQIGASTILGYFSQNSLDVLNPELTILEHMQNEVPNSSIGSIRNLLGAFKFSGDAADKKIKILSGGEKSRVVLASILSKPTNVLVLDEPTNHLDIDSREMLLEAILEYPGTVILVSHDRHFLKKITTRVFELDKQQMNIFDSSFEEYLAKSLKTQ